MANTPPKKNFNVPTTALEAKVEADRLIALGYRRTSNAYRMISRIDRPDWKEVQAARREPVDADWYRRCRSTDTIEGISPAVFRLIPGSNHDRTGFCPGPDEVPA